MASTSGVIRPAGTRFLPAAAFVMIASVVLERTISGHGIPDFRGLYWPALLVIPLVLAIGYGLGLFLVRNRVAAAPTGTLRHLMAAVAAIVGLGIASVFTQGSRPPRVAGICLVVGFLVALATFRRRSASRVTSEAAVA